MPPPERPPTPSRHGRLLRPLPCVLAWGLGLYLAGMYIPNGIQKFDDEGFRSPYFVTPGRSPR